MNNFEEFGFTGDFDGEVLKEFDNYLIGYLNDDGIIRPAKWFKTVGICENRINFNITPIKKEWYEREGKVLCLHKNDNEYFTVTTPLESFALLDAKNGTLRLATKEEALSLVMEETK